MSKTIIRKSDYARHKMGNTPEYRSWGNMCGRCDNPNNPAFKDYGGRNITVAPVWRCSFLAFYAAMGPKPGPGYSLERLDNSKGYEPGNVVWGTKKAQARNRRSNRMIVVAGESMCLATACEKFDLKYWKLKHLIYKGMSGDEAVVAARFIVPRPVRGVH